MDANFRLKNHLISNFSADPGLWNGMAYMTPRIPYETYVLSQADTDDVSVYDLCIWQCQILISMEDQYVRGLPSTCKGDDSKYKGTSIYWSWWRNVRAK